MSLLKRLEEIDNDLLELVGNAVQNTRLGRLLIRADEKFQTYVIGAIDRVFYSLYYIFENPKSRPSFDEYMKDITANY